MKHNKIDKSSISNSNRVIFILLGSLFISLFANMPRLVMAFGINTPAVFEIKPVLLCGYFCVTYCYCVLLFYVNLQVKTRKDAQQKRNSLFIMCVFNIALYVMCIGILMQLTKLPILNGNTLDVQYKFLFVSNGFILLLIIWICYIIRLFELKQKQALEIAQLQKESALNQLSVLQSQIDPHFLFNSLNTLHYLIGNDTKKAQDFLGRLSSLFRNKLQMDIQGLISIKEELEFCNDYIFLLKERFEDNFSVTISIPENDYDSLIPVLSLQILVENAVKHNEISSENPLEINIYTQDTFLIVENPICLKKHTQEREGTGLLNLEKRYQLLKKQSIIINKEQLFVVKLPL